LTNKNRIESQEVNAVFDHYPVSIQEKLIYLRSLVLETALETDGVSSIEETLKWGEPSYLAKGGSTIRLGWNKSKPNQYVLYFHCKTKLVDTFKELYSELLKFDGNRAIVFNVNDEVPSDELRHCISLSLTYHRIKHLPMLGA